MSTISLRRVLLAATGASAFAAACAKDASAPSATTGLTQQQAVQVGTQLAHEIGGAISSLGAGSTGSLALMASPSLDRFGSALATTPCPSPDNTADADHDGVPDNATITFALPQCRTVLNGDTTEITGVVRLSDPVFSPPPDVKAFGYQATIANLVTRVGSAIRDSSFTETRNGALALVADSTGLAQAHAFDLVRVDAGGRSHLATTWQARFTPATGSALVLGAALPRGFFAAQGTTAWQRNDVAQQFAIATARPLDVDPTCADTAPNKFRSGEVRAVVAGDARATFVRIVFANCAQPVITLQTGS